MQGIGGGGVDCNNCKKRKSNSLNTYSHTHMHSQSDKALIRHC